MIVAEISLGDLVYAVYPKALARTYPPSQSGGNHQSLLAAKLSSSQMELVTHIAAQPNPRQISEETFDKLRELARTLNLQAGDVDEWPSNFSTWLDKTGQYRGRRPSTGKRVAQAIQSLMGIKID